MAILKKITRVVFVCAFLAGACWFIIPAFKGAYYIGGMFGTAICLTGAAILVFYRFLTKNGGYRAAAVKFFVFFYAVGLIWAVYLSSLMFSVKLETPEKGLNVIVLGARIYSLEKMSTTLAARVDEAYRYLSDNPDSVCIVTGGQGDNEPCPEALAQQNALLKKGIAYERIFVEDKSRNTRQNMKNSSKIIEENQLENKFLITTQYFHMYRAIQLARDVGIEAYPMIAYTDPMVFPEYFGRELLSLTKWKLEEIFIV